MHKKSKKKIKKNWVNRKLTIPENELMFNVRNTLELLDTCFNNKLIWSWNIREKIEQSQINISFPTQTSLSKSTCLNNWMSPLLRFNKKVCLSI